MTKIDRVYRSIVEQIDAGTLKDGDRLPSEEQLASSLNVSVGTVQKALGRLAQAGLVSREHGRGTFVSSGRVPPGDIDYLRFRDAEGRELPHYIHVKSIRKVSGRGPWSAFLGESAAFFRIARGVNVSENTRLHSEFWLRADDFLKLDPTDRQGLSSNLRQLLHRKLSLPTLRVDQWMHFEIPPKAVARDLSVSDHHAALVMEIRGYTTHDQPLYYQKVFFPPFTDRLVIVR